MLAALSALVASACVLASVRSLACAVSPTWLDPRLLVEALRGDRVADWPRLGAAVATCAGAQWETDLFAALGAADERARTALVNEQLRELDWRARRWARVPRVCASVATSAGFLFACIALMREAALGPADVGEALVSALGALAIGIAGTSFCIAVHVRVRRIVRERLAATDRLVDRIESFESSNVTASKRSPTA
jgi:hypothetical protein